MGIFSSLFGAPTVQLTPVRTGAQFQAEVLQSELPVIVDVWSQSCPPCRRLWPVLEKVATKHQGAVKVVEISTDAERSLLQALRVMATPTLILYAEGEEIGRTTGFKPPSWFDEMIHEELS